MRKSLLLLFTLVLAVSLVTVGCGGTGKDDRGGTEVKNLLMATGGTGGTYYPLGGAIADVWSQKIEGVKVTVQSTGASVENIRLLSSGETDLAMAMNGVAQAAWKGEGDFKGSPVNNIAGAGVIYPEIMQVIAPKDSGIKTIADLKGKRVSIGPVGSGTASSAVKILQAYGIDPDKDIKKFQDTFADAARKIKDGNLDAAFAVLAVPAANIVDITTAVPVNIVDIEGEGLKKLLESEPAFSPFEIPAGTYEGEDEVGHTVAQWASLYVPADMDEDLVYNLTKNMYENIETIASAHARGNQISLDNAVKGFAPVPLHPGAEKYFKEVGVLK
ncbi:TRAP transporter TAXI family solute receptor [Desulfohalotomaculum tongense]|uniref:TAXI family TRAP transporter solute-binding subunit n=1 Tax=Desulforadius tongensis TaxID=1216062 RepID=UPI001959F44F|nr:TAXI family TRAP transporter solute-binding subunit [Desulforadius tongensis]MBM7855087.1 TRAP transporter TAXI family solute receptor [Desulforadius tongensis]